MNRSNANAAKSRATPKPCALCGRVTRRGTTEHHLIPRRCHHNTVESLLAHEQIGRFVAWVRDRN
ncbi:hypothetical protein [Planctomycetes bacterium TBK1r]|uniref:hypothetical protein n=1 Tax=Stieleria magnilauensis TaxID=2527963 RepID=UPI00119D74B6